MAKTIYFLLLLLSLEQCRCGNEGIKATSSANKSSLVRDTLQPTSNQSFLNGITLKPTGSLVISSAYLTGESGNLIPPRNIVERGEAVYLNLVIQDGWKTINGRIAPGALQIITTDKGEIVVETSDLFSGTPTVPAAEGKKLQLKAMITKSRPDIRYFNVQFRIWDKNGAGEAEGQYRLWLAGKES